MESASLRKSPSVQAPRVLFFGMTGNFSSPALITLLESGVTVDAVIVPASPLPGSEPFAIRCLERPTRRPILPLAHTISSILHIAWERQIPVWEVSNLKDAQTLSILRSYEPDILCVACFSLLIPSSALALPRLGCLNVHPGLLPANRGPVPLFWTFREWDEYAGVTIHLMEEKMDSGAILEQEKFAVPQGIRYEQLESECARLGGVLLTRAVWGIFKGNAQPVPQDETKSSYHSFPTEADLVVIPQKWNARHLYNFIHGVAAWSGSIELRIADKHVLVHDAISYLLEEAGQRVEDSIVSGELIVSCRDGYVRVLFH